MILGRNIGSLGNFDESILRKAIGIYSLLCHHKAAAYGVRM